MVAETFNLWEELKAYAAEYAATNRPVPIDGECGIWLQRMIDKHFPGIKLREEAFEFYAEQLRAMIATIRLRGR